MVQKQKQSIADVISARRTQKVMAKDAPVELPHADIQQSNSLVMRSIEVAGLAPFHYDRKYCGVAEPWRFYVIWNRRCRELALELPEWFSDVRPGNKLAAMLNACGALVLVNWLPQFDVEETEEKKQQINEEHLAATATAVQNLLLMLTDAGLGNYWSSGGFFRTDLMFEKLGIDRSEKLLGAIFVDYGAPEAEVDVVDGKQHANRSDYLKWTSVIE